jgi:hypothetical protein
MTPTITRYNWSYMSLLLCRENFLTKEEVLWLAAQAAPATARDPSGVTVFANARTKQSTSKPASHQSAKTRAPRLCATHIPPNVSMITKYSDIIGHIFCGNLEVKS